MVARWFKGFTKLWEERLEAVGIQLSDPVFQERAEQLKAEGRWPLERPELFGIKIELADEDDDED
ncbi:MAG: hypothetical protein ACKO1N_01985 [Erythrobacter sp.]